MTSSSLSARAEKTLATLKEVNMIAWAAVKHHRTHKNEKLDLENNHFLQAVYYDKSEYLVIMKATQCYISEFLHCRAITKAIMGMSIFYVLPTYNIVQRVVRNRIDKCLANTRYYRTVGMEQTNVQDAKKSQNISLKHLGLGTIAFVGSNSTPAFTEFPADEVIIDELDECDQSNLTMAWERMSASKYRTQVKVANPTIMGFGIDTEYKETDRKHWYIKCECGKWVSPDWFKHVVEEVETGMFILRDDDWEADCGKDIRLFCDHCGKPFDRHSDGEWIPEVASKRSGYQISKMFSGATTMVDLLERFNAGLRNESEMQRFYNGDLGLPYNSRGAKIIRDVLDSARGEHMNGAHIPAGIGVMGIDVGKVLNVVIGRILPDKRIIVTHILEMNPEEVEVARYARENKVSGLVMDAAPELYLVRKVKSLVRGAFACTYGGQKTIRIDRARNITVDRTASLDEVREMLMLKSVILPENAAEIPGFYNQMMASTRVFKEDKGDSGAYEWFEGAEPDHYFHAMNYMILAAKLVMSFNQ